MFITIRATNVHGGFSEKILNYFPNKNKKLKILDLCTGSGCIAISLAKEYLNAKVTATDISTKALKVAKINSQKIHCNNIKAKGYFTDHF